MVAGEVMSQVLHGAAIQRQFQDSRGFYHLTDPLVRCFRPAKHLACTSTCSETWPTSGTEINHRIAVDLQFKSVLHKGPKSRQSRLKPIWQVGRLGDTKTRFICDRIAGNAGLRLCRCDFHTRQHSAALILLRCH